MGIDGMNSADIFDEYFDDRKLKYIIKNCPMYFHSNCYGHTGNCYCQDCTDCVLKQIVGLCKDAQSECSCQNPIEDIDCFECTLGGRAELGTEILKLLDIEEVE